MSDIIPGPWTIKYETNIFAGERLIASTGGHTSNISGNRVYEENVAHAILIAALPELLEALIESNKLLDWRSKPKGAIHIESARRRRESALIKALGYLPKESNEN